MRIFDKKLTNRSLLILETLMDAINVKSEITDVIVACHQGGLSKYANKNGMKERFGSRVKKSNEVSFLFQILNGLANENEVLRKEVEVLKNAK